MKGLRFDKGKIRFHLVPPAFERALARHFHIGALKYEPRNWEHGMEWSRVYNPIRRHLDAFIEGEAYDEETGSHHLICAAWGCCVLFIYQLRGIGTNDLEPVYSGDDQQYELWLDHNIEEKNDEATPGV